MSDHTFLDPILRCEPDLERWRIRAGHPEQPEQGSELEADDKVFPFHRISEVVRTSLAISGENLRIALDAIHRWNLYPSAHFTSLRSALVGACQAVWILASEDPTTRRDRGLCVVDESYQQSAKFHRATKNLTPNLSSDDETALDDQLTWIAGRRQQVVDARPSRFALNLTADVIPTAAGVVYQDAERQSQVSLLWMQMSGDAHVLGWSTFQRAEAGATNRLTGLAQLSAGGSLKDIAQPFIASYDILKRGWSLYDRRCEGRR